LQVVAETRDSLLLRLDGPVDPERASRGLVCFSPRTDPLTVAGQLRALADRIEYLEQTGRLRTGDGLTGTQSNEKLASAQVRRERRAQLALAD
jgi:hypothetical protein